MLSVLYSSAARARRWYYTPARQRHLSYPVISIGNLASGGRAKTPMAALTARILLEAGERPSILSRGYARERAVETPVIVRDASAVRATVRESGDEPMMLAEMLPGAIVVVHADRARAGIEAERLGATCHVLDDGFQHLRLARDIEIVMLDVRDLGDRPYPAGRLREEVDALDHADAIVVIGGTDEERWKVTRAIEQVPGVSVFRAAKKIDTPAADRRAAPAWLISGLADNAQFARGVRDAGWTIAGEQAFGDHHVYSDADAATMAQRAASSGATFVLTTEKDAVRLRPVWRADLPIVTARLELALDDEAAYRSWLLDHLKDARTRRAGDRHRRAEDGARAS